MFFALFIKDLTFVTVIRDEGVPSSLNVISDKRGPGGPLLTPYPNWNWTSTKSCSNIISVYRVSVIQNFSIIPTELYLSEHIGLEAV